MKILFIGDIVGAPGRHMAEKHLPRLIDEYKIDFVIANGENSAGGAGISRKVFNELTAMGIDAFTMGNHIWDNKDIFNFIDNEKRIVRPANFNPTLPGTGYQIFDIAGQKLVVANLVGRTFMPPTESPFIVMDKILTKTRNITPFVFVDFHAEATSEKNALAWYLDGQVSAVIGTHTHIQTNDARVLPRGTALVTDAGMTGPRDSILGVEWEIIVKHFITQMPARFNVAKGDIQFNGVMIELYDDGRAKTVEPINFWEPSL
jgi:metallophosphoesterase (TIGR00282 family)